MGKHLMNLRKLGRNTAHRLAMLRTMCDQLIEHERIETTVVKAKELRRFADKMITLGKDGSLEARRRARGTENGREFNKVVRTFSREV